MPAVNPRITITLQPQVHAILRELSALTGNSQSALVGDLLAESVPIFERMATVLRAARKLTEEGQGVRSEITRSLERAQGRIEKQLGLALDDMDEAYRPIIEEGERVSRRSGRSGARGAPARGGSRAPERPPQTAPTPLSNRGVRSPRQQVSQAKKRGR